MAKQKFFDRISFPTEYRDRKELKTSMILLFFTCLIFFIISSSAIIMNLFLFSKTLLLGTIAYEFILFYLLKEQTKEYIKEKIKGKAKRTLDISTSIIFGILILVTFATLLYTMLTPNPLTENKFISLSAALILIVGPTFFWHELVMFFKKKGFKGIKWLGFGLMFLIVVSAASAQNNTTNGGLLSTIGQTADTVQQGLNFISDITNFFTNIQTTIGNTLNLTPQQTQVVLLIGVLIGAFLLLRFLGVIVKWVIVILIAWIVIQMFFL